MRKLAPLAAGNGQPIPRSADRASSPVDGLGASPSTASNTAVGLTAPAVNGPTDPEVAASRPTA